MASASQSASIGRLQVGDIFVKTLDNSTIPPSYTLISNGGGTTRWDSISSIFPVSSFKTVQASDGSSFSADLSNNTILISTNSIPSTFRSYVDPLTSSLMLSLTFPPITINNGSVPFITNTFVVPNPAVISSTSLQSTIRFYGLNDIFFSTVDSVQAVYVGISSFTSAGYSTLNGEMIGNPKVSYSSFSTAMGVPTSQSFTSSIPFVNNYSVLDYPSTNGIDVFMSSITFDATHITKYINMSSMKTTVNIEYYPNFQMPVMVNPGYAFPTPPFTVMNNNQTLVKQVTSYIQLNSGMSSVILPETSNVRFMNSQQVIHSTFYFSTNYFAVVNQYTPGSNYFSDTIRMTVNPYTVSTYVGLNLPQSTTFQMWHIISSALYLSPSVANSNIGFITPTLVNTLLQDNALFLRVNNVITSPGN